MRYKKKIEKFWIFCAKRPSMSACLDGYYEYNFNHPVGRVNLLRAYDVLSNLFSLNQASVIFEHAPDVSAHRRWGGRLDLQFGQATDTLQGNPLNEPRPEIYGIFFRHSEHTPNNFRLLMTFSAVLLYRYRPCSHPSLV